MRKILFISHGSLAEGLNSALQILAGDQPHVTFINAYGAFGDPDAKIEHYFSQIQEDDEVIILADIGFGSVSQKVIPYLSSRVHLIAGMNLPLAITLITTFGELDIDHLITESRNSIVYVNEQLANISLDQDDE